MKTPVKIYTLGISSLDADPPAIAMLVRHRLRPRLAMTGSSGKCQAGSGISGQVNADCQDLNIQNSFCGHRPALAR